MIGQQYEADRQVERRFEDVTGGEQGHHAAVLRGDRQG